MRMMRMTKIMLPLVLITCGIVTYAYAQMLPNNLPSNCVSVGVGHTTYAYGMMRIDYGTVLFVQAGTENGNKVQTLLEGNRDPVEVILCVWGGDDVWEI
jgi:hypothetical protein